jgi:ABC-type transport system involved in multi-copper enzyme maturation permease subunit
MIRFDMSLTIPLEYAELVLVTLVTPASIYAAISGEREKATWDALILTRLTPAQIIVGKVAWRVAVILLIMAVMLVAIFVSQFMGKDPFDRPTWPALLVAQAMILAWGVLLAAFSLWVSSRTKQSVTTISAVVGTMLGTLLLFPTLLGNFGLADSWERSRTLQEKMAFYFICANPFLILWMVNGRHVNASEAPPLQPIPWAIVLTVVYAAAAALFLSATHRSIRKLEEPIQRS